MDKKLIYHVLNGDVDVEEAGLPEGFEISNAFAEGSECGRLYDQVYAAKLRLNERLHTDEDEDIEQIISNMNRIMKIIAFQMYAYGEKAGTL